MLPISWWKTNKFLFEWCVQRIIARSTLLTSGWDWNVAYIYYGVVFYSFNWSLHYTQHSDPYSFSFTNSKYKLIFARRHTLCSGSFRFHPYHSVWTLQHCCRLPCLIPTLEPGYCFPTTRIKKEASPLQLCLARPRYLVRSDKIFLFDTSTSNSISTWRSQAWLPFLCSHTNIWQSSTWPTSAQDMSLLLYKLPTGISSPGAAQIATPVRLWLSGGARSVVTAAAMHAITPKPRC